MLLVLACGSSGAKSQRHFQLALHKHRRGNAIVVNVYTSAAPTMQPTPSSQGVHVKRQPYVRKLARHATQHPLRNPAVQWPQ